jgi:hypothetical protein
MALVITSARDLLAAIVPILHKQNMLFGSPCEIEVEPYQPYGGIFHPAVTQEHIANMCYLTMTDLAERIEVIGMSFTKLIRSYRLTNLTGELSVMRGFVLRMVTDAIEAHVEAPFNVEASGERWLTVYFQNVHRPDVPERQQCKRLVLNDGITWDADKEEGVQTLQLLAGHRTFKFPYAMVPALDADGEVTDEKTLTEADTQQLVETCMNALFSVNVLTRITADFFHAKHEMVAQEQRWTFQRELASTLFNNQGVFAGMLEPGALQVAWLPRPNMRGEAFAMLTVKRLGEGSMWRDLDDEVIKIIVRLVLDFV